MKAISVKQPWANLIASGVKTIETRWWYTRYRGWLLIVSSKQPRIAPAGCAVARARLVDCRRRSGHQGLGPRGRNRCARGRRARPTSCHTRAQLALELPSSLPDP